MRKNEEITDRFDSASETSWAEHHWNLRPYSRDIKPSLLFGFASSVFVTMLVLLWERSLELQWMNNMQSLYAPYETAVLELEKLEYCDSSWCVGQKEKLQGKKEEAWNILCKADNAEEYVRRLMSSNLPYQGCEQK